MNITELRPDDFVIIEVDRNAKNAEHFYSLSQRFQPNDVFIVAGDVDRVSIIRHQENNLVADVIDKLERAGVGVVIKADGEEVPAEQVGSFFKKWFAGPVLAETRPNENIVLDAVHSAIAEENVSLRAYRTFVNRFFGEIDIETLGQIEEAQIRPPLPKVHMLDPMGLVTASDYRQAMKRAENAETRVKELENPWHPWESAPRDGQVIDVWVKGRVNDEGMVTGIFRQGDYFTNVSNIVLENFGTPTHWKYPTKGPRP